MGLQQRSVSVAVPEMGGGQSWRLAPAGTRAGGGGRGRRRYPYLYRFIRNMLNAPSFLVDAPDPARFPAGQAHLGSAASTGRGRERSCRRRGRVPVSGGPRPLPQGGARG